MADDSSLSASELRQRYHRGGTVRDDELTSAQLRSRHAIPANPKDFSTGQDKNGGSGSMLLIIVAILAILVVLGGVFFLNK